LTFYSMTMLTIRCYKPRDAKRFRDLNVAWIEKYFEIEDEDRTLLQDPDASIIACGGRILIAELDKEIVGTVALIPSHEESTVELAKMAVHEDVRRRGVGKELMNSAVALARDMGAQRIWLETNTRLEAALALYRRFDFRELAEAQQVETSYCRCNCQMVLEL